MSAGKELILILGGVRAGKSSFAQKLAAQIGSSVTFVATAEAGDEEMRRRIEQHQRSRPLGWRTVEAPLHPAAALRGTPPADVVLLDCLTLLVSNLMLREDPGPVAERVSAEVSDLLGVFERGPSSFIVVSNEVGLGVVPPYPSGRAFRDLLGSVNQRLAQRADRVYWMLAGLPLEMKASGLVASWERPHGHDC